MVALRDAALSAAKGAIARTCLRTLPPAELGEIVLRDAQRFMVARAQRAIELNGGCLIADDVGRGKTFVALAIARSWRVPLVIAPASLRTSWMVAAARAGVIISFGSTEGLSRSPISSRAFDGVIVDESQHFRNRATRRYERLAECMARMPVVMLSATPFQNRETDLAAQVALFHGERAFSLDAESLAAFVLRGSAAADLDLPSVEPPQWVDVGVDESDVLDAIVALPTPARPLDGGDAGALRTISLVRAWSSSRAALLSALRSRRRLATAIEQGIEAGRLPTRRESLSWVGTRDSVQLGFASMLVGGAPDQHVLGEAREGVRAELSALGAIASTIRSLPDPDIARAAQLSKLRAECSGRRVLVFTEFASTARRMFELLCPDGQVGLSTAGECRIAGGRLGRDELLSRFAPVSQRAHMQPQHGNVALLITTDLLSEGVNLQDASVVVHLDLPWNPARLAQRVGRVRRPGGSARVLTFLVAPPARADALLQTHDRLRAKVARAGEVIGRSFDVLPALVPGDVNAAAAGRAEFESLVLEALARWTDDEREVRNDSPTVIPSERSESRNLPGLDSSTSLGMTARESCPLVATVIGAHRGWLAALDDGSVVAGDAHGVGDSHERALRIIRAINAGVETGCDEHRESIANARAALDRWRFARELAASCGLGEAASPARALMRKWLATQTRASARHQRAEVYSAAATLARLLACALPLGTERALVQLSRDHDSRGLAAIRRAIAMASVDRIRSTKQRADVVALIVVVPLSS